MAPNPRRQDERLAALYERVPKIDCQGLCRDSCGPVEMSVRERQRIERLHGTVTCGSGASCSMLTEERRCRAYDIRPMICRLWGVLEQMPCPYGCKPERYLTAKEGFDLMIEAERIGVTPGVTRLQRELEASIRHLEREDPEGLARRIDTLARSVMRRPTVDGRIGALPPTVIEQ